MECCLSAVSDAGAARGLQLHWGKLQLLKVRSKADMKRPDMSNIQREGYITYLGSAVSADGRLSKELSRRLGMAYAIFRDLARLWRHSALRRKRKVQIFNMVVVSKLLCGFAACCLSTS
jgi:hypothetical protein